MKTQLNIAEIPYLNCAPFFWNKRFEIPGVNLDWVFANPKELGNLALRGGIDTGPVSLLQTVELAEEFELLPFGISAIDEAKSVILLSKRPPAYLENAKIGLTEQSATSTELLRLLFKEVYKVNPDYSFGFSDTDEARLFIGDQALFALLDPLTKEEFPHQLDLGRAWKQWKGHSFVFARWMIRKDLPADVKTSVQEWVSENIRNYKENPNRAMDAFERARQWKITGALDYISNFNYMPNDSDYLGCLNTLGQFSGQLATSRS